MVQLKCFAWFGYALYVATKLSISFPNKEVLSDWLVGKIAASDWKKHDSDGESCSLHSYCDVLVIWHTNVSVCYPKKGFMVLCLSTKPLLIQWRNWSWIYAMWLDIALIFQILLVLMWLFNNSLVSFFLFFLLLPLSFIFLLSFVFVYFRWHGERMWSSQTWTLEVVGPDNIAHWGDNAAAMMCTN